MMAHWLLENGKTVLTSTRVALLTASMIVLLPQLAAAATSSPEVRCGDVLTADTTLTTDLDCTGNGLVITTSGVTLDLAGHTVSGAGTGVGVAIADEPAGAPVSDVTVRNGRIRGFDTGVLVDNGHTVGLSGLRLTDDGFGANRFSAPVALLVGDHVTVDRTVIRPAHGAAVAVDGTDQVALHRSRVTGGSIVLADNSVGDSITGSTLTDANVAASRSADLVISGNRLVRSGVGILEVFSAIVRDNRISGATAGVTLDIGAFDTQITGNDFTGNGVGVSAVVKAPADAIRGTLISGNVFTRNAAAGVLLAAQDSRLDRPITVSGNRFARNGYHPGGLTDLSGRPVDDGLHIDVPAGTAVTVAANRTSRNADHGIEAQPGTVIDGGGNRSTGDPYDCLGVTCT
jgi:nitrous oxidase accessory protein NosD